MKRQTIPTILAALLLALVLTYVSVGSQSNLYAVTDLNIGDPTSSFVLSINNAGQVVGYTEASPGWQGQGFLYSAGKKKGLHASNVRGRASGINATGMIVGGYVRAGTIHACRFDNGKVEDLGTLGGRRSEAEAINAAGEIVGNSGVGDRTQHAFLYKDGRMQDLGTLGGDESDAHSINDRGQIAGSSATVRGGMHAFLFQDGSLQDLGTLGGDQSYAYAVNQAGHVIGCSDMPNGETHAFLYRDGRMQDMGTLDQGICCFAYGLNNRDEFVGSSDRSNGIIHAFVYKAGRMRDLNRLIPANSGWVLTEAKAINDKGQIAGIGIVNGQTRAFLLTPQ